MTQTRMTRQRAVILETLRSVTSHPSADELYGMVRKKMPKISLGTVYRNLDLLVDGGAVRLLDRAGMQKRFDGDLSPHTHIRCECCGRVGDVFTPVEVSALANDAVPGFTISRAEVEFVGLCDACKH